MVKLRLILERIEQVRRDVKALQKLLLAKPINLAFSPQILLKLSKSEINALVALKLIGGKGSASEVANLLGIARAMASASLNVVHRIGLVGKSHEGHLVIFTLNVDEP